MKARPWAIDYFEGKFAKPDPWKYFASPYERTKYDRQIDVIKDRSPDPKEILEIGCAEGAMTLLLAESFRSSRITAIEISANALGRAKNNLLQVANRIELINADITEYQTRLTENYYDVIVWSESIYYLGARLPQTALYDLMGAIIGKLKARGLFITANTLDLPEGIPESAVTKRPLIDCYYIMLSSLVSPISRSTYYEEKLNRMYEYQVWAFEKD
ncbi:MAG: SAM-dependent methyltransferase [Methanotrichaceae archaeon]|jgi:SAM-dependent methyltransferase